MRRQDFTYTLPPALIAQQPLAERSASRLLYLPAVGPQQDRRFSDLPSLLRPGDLLVVNDTRVIPARLRGRRDTGGQVEALIERLLGERDVLAQLRASKALKPGARIEFAGGGQQVGATVGGRQGEFFELRFDRPIAEWLDAIGALPLPPYIARSADADDAQRYQTIYGRQPGAVAASTAGLHFDEALLDQLRAMGVEVGTVTLHVGAGTFKPVRVDDLAEHRMHAGGRARGPRRRAAPLCRCGRAGSRRRNRRAAEWHQASRHLFRRRGGLSAPPLTKVRRREYLLIPPVSISIQVSIPVASPCRW